VLLLNQWDRCPDTGKMEGRARRHGASGIEGGRPALRVLDVSVALAASTVLLWVLVVRYERAIPAPVSISWWVLAAGFCCTEIWVMHLQFRRETHTISLSEVVLVLGLVFATPAALLGAYVLGAGLAMGVHRRQPVLKLAFNLSMLGLECCVAEIVFRAMLPGHVAAGPSVWVAAFGATLTVSLVAAVAVTAVIAISQGRLSHRHIPRVAASSVAVGALNACLGSIAVSLLWADAQSAWLLAAAAVILVGGYRGYAGLRSRHTSLELLYEFTKAVGRSPSADEVVRAVLAQARELLRAEVAQLVFIQGERIHTVTLGRDEELVRRDDRGPVPRILTRVIDDRRPVLLSKKARDGERRAWLEACGWRDAIAAPLRGEDGAIGIIAVADRLGDVSTFNVEDTRLFETIANHASVALENGRLVDRLHHEALHDALTGLPNRAYFNERLAQALASQPRRSLGPAVMLMDLDRFKEVNDSLGHHNGDILLKEVARRLAAVVRGGDAVARLGGDEFAILVPRPKDEAAMIELAGRIRTALEEPFANGDLVLEVGATVGISICPDHGEDATTLVQRADVAMYAAKASHAGVAVYSPEIDEYSPRRLALVSELRHAISAEELPVHYQPKARVASGEIVGVEALARWVHRSDGFVVPDEFIPLAERSGLIGALTAHVLRQAIHQCRAWLDAGIAVPVAVNLSTRSLLDPQLPADVQRFLDENELPTSFLTLEVTESAVMSDPARTLTVLQRLDTMGVSISVDDFGTGYSSLSYLKRLPVREVKIDKSFVQTMTRDANDAMIVRSIIDLGQNLGLAVVAEGVEDQATWDELGRLGCDVIQGYFLRPPSAPDDLTAWLADRRTSAPAPR